MSAAEFSLRVGVPVGHLFMVKTPDERDDYGAPLSAKSYWLHVSHLDDFLRRVDNWMTPQLQVFAIFQESHQAEETAMVHCGYRVVLVRK